MKNYNKTGKVIKNFNENEDQYEIGDVYTADRFHYDAIKAKGFVTEGKEVKQTITHNQNKIKTDINSLSKIKRNIDEEL